QHPAGQRAIPRPGPPARLPARGRVAALPDGRWRLARPRALGHPRRRLGDAVTEPPGWSAESALIHGGTHREAAAPVIPPPAVTSIFISAGDPAAGPGYGRNENPTWAAVEESLGAIEGADAVLFSSGQAASMALMLALAGGRDRILLPRD